MMDATPPYMLPPYQYRGNEMFTLSIETEPDYLRALVPEPMVPNADNLLHLYVGWLHVTEPRAVSYGEAGIMVPVSLGDRVGTYMPVLYLDEVELLVSGREVWGFPKVEGEIDFKSSEDSVSATVHRDGKTIISMEMAFTGEEEPLPGYARDHFLLKSIPAVDGDGYDLRRINTCHVHDDERKLIRTGNATLALDSVSGSPLGELPVRNIVRSAYSVGDIVLGHGEVVHDYLAES